MPKPKVILSPYSRPLRNGKRNAKDYPFWEEVVDGLRDVVDFHQIGRVGEPRLGGVATYSNPSLKEVESLISNCLTWTSVDNFLPHLCANLKKPGIVIFGRSDPNIFGHKQNTNLLKDRRYLRPDQFNYWEELEFSAECFVPSSFVVGVIMDVLYNRSS